MEQSARSETSEASRKRIVLAAVLLMLLGGMMSSLLHVGVRVVSPEVPTIQIVLLRSVFTILVTFPLLFRKGQVSWRTNRLDLQAMRGVVGVCSMTAWYYALSILPLADAGALSFTTAIFVTLGAALMFGESVGVRRWSAVVVGLIGTVIVLKPGSGLLTFGAMVAVGSSVLWAVSLLMAKNLARYDSSLTITFYQPLLIAPFAVLGTIPVWVWPSPRAWLILFGMGLVAGIGNYAYVHALRIADASISMPVDYVRLLWMVGWGYVLFAEIPAISTWVGAALIIMSTLFITWRESRRVPKP